VPRITWLRGIARRFVLRPLFFVDGILALRDQLGEPFSARFDTGEPLLEPFAFR
jgi:hypothetical protein